MPLNLPDKLPASELLKEVEYICYWITRATQHLVRCASLSWNLMPLKITTGDRSCAFALQYTSPSGKSRSRKSRAAIKEYACRTHADILY